VIPRCALRFLASALTAVLGTAAVAGVVVLALVALLPAPADRPWWAVPEHPQAEAAVVGVTARAYLVRESARDALRASVRGLLAAPLPGALPPALRAGLEGLRRKLAEGALGTPFPPAASTPTPAPAPAETPLSPPPGPPAPPAPPAPGGPARPIVPTALRFAPPGWPQEIEQGYLELMRVRGEVLLSLDPSALGAVATGPALLELTAEVEGRRQELRPARLAVHQDILVVYRDQRFYPTLLVSYWDDSDPVDPWTGAALPRPGPADLVRETFTFERQDGVWKVVGLWREVIAYYAEGGRGAGEPDPAELVPLRDRLVGVMAEARFSLDSGRLPEVLAGRPLENETEYLAGQRGATAVLRQDHRPVLVDPVLVTSTGALLLDEVYLDSSVWLDRRTGRPLPSEPPVYRRRRLLFEQVEGTWKCVDWAFWRLGQPLT
jgi:hypothetical protein